MRRRDVNVPKVWEQLLFSRPLANGVRFLELNHLRQSAPIINERSYKLKKIEAKQNRNFTFFILHLFFYRVFIENHLFPHTQNNNKMIHYT